MRPAELHLQQRFKESHFNRQGQYKYFDKPLTHDVKGVRGYMSWNTVKFAL